MDQVSLDLLEALAALAPKAAPGPLVHGFDLALWILEHGLAVASQGPWAGGKKWVLNPCPWNGEHTNKAAFIVQFASGAIAAGCHHNGCQGKGWHELRDLFEPGWRQAKQRNGHAPNGAGSASPPPKKEDKPQPVVVRLSAVRPQAIAWLWLWWIPSGTLTLLDGDPGLGKSTMALDLVARLTLGQAMPSSDATAHDPAGVLLLSAEDDPANTVRPRLDAAGANSDLVHLLDAIRVGDEDQPPVLPFDLGRMADLVRDEKIKLVVIDPLMAFISAEYDAHRDQDIRRCLHQLTVMARKLNVSILLIRHLNKLSGGPAMYRGGGSIGIIGAARAAMVVGRDPQDEQVRVLAMNKSNLGPLPKSLGYRLVPAGSVARVEWIGETDLKPEDILWHRCPGGPGRPAKGVEEAEQWLRDKLAGGPRPAGDIFEEADQAGHSVRTIKRAKEKLGITARRLDNRWLWFPPANPPE